LPPTTSGLETEWDYSGRKKIGKAKERKEKVKREKDEEVNGAHHICNKPASY